MFATRLSDRVQVVTGDYLAEHMTVIDTGDGLIVIDTLATMPATRAALPLIADFSRAPVRLVINTHLDADHTAGNHLFRGVTCLCHANGRRHLGERVFDDPESKGQIGGLVASLEGTRAAGNADPRLPVYIDMYRSLLDGFRDFVFEPPTVFVAGGSCVSLGGTIVELHHFGPAHTDADLVAWCPAERLLVTGDVIVGDRITPIAHPGHGGSLSGLGVTARGILRLFPADARLVPGHGGIGGVELARRQEDYVEALLESLRTARAEGLSLDEAKRTAHVEAFRSSLLYDFVHPGHVELAWSELDAGGTEQTEVLLHNTGARR